MAHRPRLAVFMAGMLAALFLAWPAFFFDRDEEWRTVLAGFQRQEDTGAFVGAADALIHFHGLDGRAGRVSFTLAPRVQGERCEITIAGPAGVRHVILDGEPVDVEVPFPESRDLELKIEAATATNPRPIRLSRLRLERNLTPGSIALSLLPSLLGALVFATLTRRSPPGEAAAIAVFVIAASSFFAVIALDPVRALNFDTSIGVVLPLTLAAGFAAVGVLGTGTLAAGIGLIGSILSLHLSVVHSGFVYDDRLWARPWTLSEVASTFAGSEDPRGISGEQYRPIPSVTHALDHALYGSSPFAFHGTNLALHALSASVLFALLLRLRVPRKPAFIGALSFAIHPLAASSIGWISERTDTLADIFILTTIIVFMGAGGTRTLRILGLALLAMWSKETAVMLPVLVALFALTGLGAEERRARLPALRALFAFAVLYVAVWVSLFPEKTVGRLQATATGIETEGGWLPFFGGLFGELFHPMGFEKWRLARSNAPVGLWAALALGLALACLCASFFDRKRTLAWRLGGLGLAFSAIIVLPTRGHEAIEVYRLGHGPAIGIGIMMAGFAWLVARDSPWRHAALALLLLLRFGPVSRETSAAWGYPGFQFRMALRFNLENPVFLGGLTAEMRRDLERESRFEAHRDEPLEAPFVP